MPGKSALKRSAPPYGKSSWEVIASLCEQELGIGFVPDYIVHDERRRLKEIDMGMPAFYTIGAIFPKADKLSRKAQALLDVFQT